MPEIRIRAFGPFFGARQAEGPSPLKAAAGDILAQLNEGGLSVPGGDGWVVGGGLWVGLWVGASFVRFERGFNRRLWVDISIRRFMSDHLDSRVSNLASESISCQ